MSYARYLQDKQSAQQKIINTRKPTDASMITQQRRFEANQVFFADGQGKGSLAMDTTRPDGVPLLQHPSTSSSKKSTRPASASDFTSFRGAQGTGIVKSPIIVQEGCCETSLPSTFIARRFAIVEAQPRALIVVGEDTTQSGKTIYRSIDGGLNWSLVSETTTFLRAGYGIAADSSGLVVAVGTYDDGNNTSVLYSDDGGVTWTSKPGSYFAVEGHGVAWDGSTGWMLVGDDKPNSNHIKYCETWTVLTGSSVTNEINQAAGGFSTQGKAWGVATNREGQFVIVGEDTGFNTIRYNATSGDYTSWAGSVGSAFAVVGYGVDTDRSGNWVMVGNDGPGSPYNIKWFANDSFSSCTSVTSNTFTSYGTSAYYDGDYSRWVLTGSGDASVKIAQSFTDIQSGGFTDNFSPMPTVYAFTLGIFNSLFVGGQDAAYPIQYYDGSKFVPVSGIPTGSSGSSVKKTTKYASASDFVRSKSCALTCEEKHFPWELGKPLFVDNTIRLSAMVPEMVNGGCCENSLVDANHIHSPGINPPTHPSQAVGKRSELMRSPPEFQNQGVGGRRSGGYYNPRSGYVENKHGNDLNVNPRRTPGPWVYTPGAPEHLKINRPTLFNIKPVVMPPNPPPRPITIDISLSTSYPTVDFSLSLLNIVAIRFTSTDDGFITISNIMGDTSGCLAATFASPNFIITANTPVTIPISCLYTLGSSFTATLIPTVSWTKVPITGGIRGAYYDGSYWVVGDVNGIRYSTSRMGPWSNKVTFNANSIIYSVYKSQSYWVAADSARGSIWYATDPTLTWTEKQLTSSNLWSVYSDGTYWVAGDINGGIWYTTNITSTWTFTQLTDSSLLSSIVSVYKSGTTWVALDSNARIWYTTNPSGTWTVRPINGAGIPLSIYSDGTSWVVGDYSGGGGIFYTTDITSTWTNVPLTNANIRSVYSDGTTWIAGDTTGAVWTAGSVSGTWTKTPLAGSNIQTLYASGTNWIAADGNGAVWYITY